MLSLPHLRVSTFQAATRGVRLPASTAVGRCFTVFLIFFPHCVQIRITKTLIKPDARLFYSLSF